MALDKSVMCQVAGCPKPGPRTAKGAEWHAANMHKDTPTTPKASGKSAKASTPAAGLDATAIATATATAVANVLGPMLAAQTQAIVAAVKPVRAPAKPKAPAVTVVGTQGPPGSNPTLQANLVK